MNMMKLKIIILYIGMILFFAFNAEAQKHLKINDVFKEYGMKDGSILVELSTDVLSGNSNISFYKSLVMTTNDLRTNDCVSALNEDIKKGTKLIESKKNGNLETGYYVVGRDKNVYEYILYKNKSKKLTLVYLKGNFPPDELEEELSGLKDLFLYINNKRIKLEN